MPLEAVGILGADATRLAQMLRPRRVVTQLRVMKAEIDGIEAQSIDTAVQPEAHVVERCLANVRVVEVQIRLCTQEIVQVVLPAARLPSPGDATEDRQPVVRRRAVLARIGPYVPVRLRIGVALTALLEPGVLAGAVAQHLVDDDLEPEA